MAYKLLEQRITPGGLNLVAPADSIAPADCLDLAGVWPGSAGRLEVAPQDSLASGATVTMNSVREMNGAVYSGSIGTGSGTLYKNGISVESGYDMTYPLGMLAYRGYLWVINSAKQRRFDGTTASPWQIVDPGAGLTGTNPALTAPAPVSVSECDPVNLIGTGTAAYYAQINMFTTNSIAGVDVGGQVTISGYTGAPTVFNGVWSVKAVYPIAGGTSLVVLESSLPPGTVFTTSGAGVFTYSPPGMPRDDYDYFLTWQTANLGESNPSAAWHVGVVNLGTRVRIDRSSMSGGIPTGVTGWNVYRQSTTMVWPYRVNTTVIDISATFYDDFGDKTGSSSPAEPQDEDYIVADLAIQVERDHIAPPAARIMATDIYNGRIVVANTAANPNRVFFTKPLEPGYFRFQDWVDVGTDTGDEIRFLAVKPGQITVYRAKSIWRILGDFGDANGRIEVVVPDLGTVGPNAVVTTSLGDYFRAPEGIYKFNGDWAQKVSTKVEPLFRGQAPENFIAETDKSQCALGFENGRLWVTTYCGTLLRGPLCYHVESDRWFRGITGYLAYGRTSQGLVGADQGVRVINGDPTTSTFAYQSAYFDCDLPDHEKTWADLVISFNTNFVGLAVTIRINKNSSFDPTLHEFTVASLDPAATAQFGGTSYHQTKQQIIPLVYPNTYPTVALRGLPVRSYNISIRLTGTAVPYASVIDSPILLHYYLEARQAKVFDTDETDHGMPGVVKVVSQVEFDIDSTAGPAALQIYSDVPGGVMTAQLLTPLVIAQTAGRQSVKIVLNPPVEGKLLRYSATTVTQFQVYNFHARITPIGVYLDGSISETWDTRPIPIAS
jgi:hypothetical protein